MDLTDLSSVASPRGWAWRGELGADDVSGPFGNAVHAVLAHIR
jgi:hypothetical protein